jgi:hypothetical protein
MRLPQFVGDMSKKVALAAMAEEGIGAQRGHGRQEIQRLRGLTTLPLYLSDNKALRRAKRREWEDAAMT